ncbi:MAG TPA: hypothetical protein VFL79_13200, partial [Terriglobia bacterium]|nr:hypothetical protein [Terriglobia bacterium]
GIRWDEQHIAGQDVKYTFTDSWSPRIGVAIDPWGDRKSKISAGYNRLHWSIPLDAAVRSLSSELDLLGLAFQPVISGTNISVVTDSAHLLNKAAGGVTTSPTIFTSGGGEFILPGTRMNMADEFMAGFEHEFKNGLVVSARYVDRRLKRIVEDMSGISPELANVGQSAPSFLGNPSPALDATVNEHKGIPFAVGTPPPASCGTNFLATTDDVGNGAEADDANGNPEAGAGNALCWPQVGVVPNNAVAAANGLVPGSPEFGGEPFSDGIADGFAKPIRVYQAVEIELNKQFSKNWMMRTSWTISKLQGNYQGAFRGDNGQRDPGISSLFDFTPGFYNLLGDQFKPGVLPTDRRHLINAYFSYVFDKYAVKNLTLGTGVQIASGTPVSNYGDHPVYQNAGEVPLGGRGILGRTPVNGQVDVHADYPFKLSERNKLRFGTDLFNIANQKTVLTIDQFRDLTNQPANSNLDFLKPGRGVTTTYQRPFYARFFVRWEF